MGTLVQKLQYIDESKRMIRDAINAKGGTLNEANPLRDYQIAINGLPTGGSANLLVGNVFTSNGVYDPKNFGYDGFGQININVPTTSEGGGSVSESSYCIDFNRFGYTTSDIESAKQLTANIVLVSEGIKNNFGPSEINLDYRYTNRNDIMYFPMVDTSNVESMQSTFNRCTCLIYIPKLDTGNVKDMSNMFTETYALKSIPCFNTCNVTNMNSMFTNSGIENVPLLDTSKVIAMNSMFSGCNRLTSVPAFNTSKVTDMGNIFGNCNSLSVIPKLDTSNVTNMASMFSGCMSLYKIEEISFKNVEKFDAMVLDTNYGSDSEIRYALIKDLGTSQSIESYDFHNLSQWGSTENTIHPEIDITQSAQSLIDTLLTYSFDRKSAGYNVCTITLNQALESRITAEQKQQIEAKGYSIIFQ